MTKADIVAMLFSELESHDAALWQPKKEKGLAFAPTNIALCKYWGKRNNQLNLPMNSSLSIALPDKGAMTTILPCDKETDVIILNDHEVSATSQFAQRTSEYLDLFRGKSKLHFQIDIKLNIPVA